MNALLTNALTVRDAERRDLAAIHGLLRELRDALAIDSPLDRERMAAIFETMRGDAAHYRNLVACEGPMVVGFLSSVCYLSLLHGAGDGSAFIGELVVARSHRNRGIGAALVRELARRLRIERREALEVGTDRANAGAARFYRRVGFDREYRLFGMPLEPDGR